MEEREQKFSLLHLATATVIMVNWTLGSIMRILNTYQIISITDDYGNIIWELSSLDRLLKTGWTAHQRCEFEIIPHKGEHEIEKGVQQIETTRKMLSHTFRNC